MSFLRVQQATFGKELFGTMWADYLVLSQMSFNMDGQIMLCTLFNNTTCEFVVQLVAAKEIRNFSILFLIKSLK